MTLLSTSFLLQALTNQSKASFVPPMQNQSCFPFGSNANVDAVPTVIGDLFRFYSCFHCFWDVFCFRFLFCSCRGFGSLDTYLYHTRLNWCLYCGVLSQSVFGFFLTIAVPYLLGPFPFPLLSSTPLPLSLSVHCIVLMYVH